MEASVSPASTYHTVSAGTVSSSSESEDFSSEEDFSLDDDFESLSSDEDFESSPRSSASSEALESPEVSESSGPSVGPSGEVLDSSFSTGAEPPSGSFGSEFWSARSAASSAARCSDSATRAAE